MPELSKFDRGRGVWIAPTSDTGRHYTADQLTRRCPLCDFPIPDALVAAGIDTHPTCHPIG